jgi:16S rRNA (guanine527-N7)-methyltransferase
MEIVRKYFADFTPRQEEQFSALQELYSSWNEKINVISRKDMENFYMHHVLHSLAITTQFNFTKNMQVMDLGCGGGFPGVPLAIFFPGTQFHMVDSINKKLKVINEIAKEIGLTNISTQHTRAEDIKNRQFDTVVSRAVAPLKDLWKWSKPLIKKNKNPGEDQPNGLICLKGGDLSKEIFESGCKPFVWDIHQLFAEDHFKDKWMLYQPAR